MALLIISLICCCLWVVSPAQDKPSGLADGLIEQHILFAGAQQEGVSCYRIPAIITAPNGDLIVAIDERVPSCGDLKWSRDINIVIRRSQDNGKSWSDIERIVDYPSGKSASDPSMIVDRVSGKIFLFYNYMDLDKEKDVYYLHMLSSSDNGLSWSDPRDITDQISKAGWEKDWKFITSGRGTQTRDGMLIHCLVNLDHGMHVFGSNDHGENWFLHDIPVIPGDESKIVELDDGSWMINSRLNNPGYRQVHVSDDRGKTWHSYADSSLLDPGCNASIIRYTSVMNGDDKNRLLFSNAWNAEDRKNLSISISYDEGKTWVNTKTIYPGSAAYSSMTVMQNGNIGLIFEKDDYTENVFVSFSLKWLTNGKDSLSNNQ